MRCVVTGAAGFIGSHLCEELLRRGHTVVGLDAFIPYYSPTIKAQNQSVVLAHPQYHFHAADLRTDDLTPLVANADVVFHLAAMPGLQNSWIDFDGYWTCNVQGTQRLLGAVRESCDRLRTFVLASTSSVYGRLALGGENAPARPISPYGVTKLAAEHLCQAYAEAYALPLVVLRYFSVYGPRQRPDMAYHRFIRAMLAGEPVVVYDDGQQQRGNTFVSDCVAATVAAVEAPRGETYNVGGGETASVLDILRRLERISGRTVDIHFEPARLGDQRQTTADIGKIASHLHWQPRTTLDEGLAAQWRWMEQAQSEIVRDSGPRASPSRRLAVV